MARRLGLRTMAMTSLFGSAALVVELIHRTMHLNW